MAGAISDGTTRWRVRDASALIRSQAMVRVATAGFVAILLLALFARIQTFPLSHDEQIHIAASRLIFDAPLYRTLGYNHLPGLPRLLGAIYEVGGVTHLLLVGRLLIFASWIATGAVLVWVARAAGAGWGIAGLALLMLAATPLLGPPGMVVTNNFLPIPLALISVQSLICAFDRDSRARSWWAALAGASAVAAVLLKISFIAMLPPLVIAALMAPMPIGPAGRVRHILLPATAGGIVALLPATSDLLSDPAATYVHTVRYFLGPHHDYWVQASGPKAMSLADKVIVAGQVWLAGGGVLACLLAGVIGWAARSTATDISRPAWPLVLLAVIAGLSATLAFVPTPAFPQYYMPPIGFVVMFLLIAYGRLDMIARVRVRPLLTVAGLLSLAVVVPRMGALPALAKPQRWTGIALHRDAVRTREAIETHAGASTGIATLSPIRALEAGIRPYPEFAAGPFVYRVARFIPRGERDIYTTTSQEELPAFLGMRRPAAILTGDEPALDGAFEAYALAQGYRQVALGRSTVRLFVRPSGDLAGIPLQADRAR